MRLQIVIPARLDSKRLPEKVLLPLAGKPLLQHVFERARDARLGPNPIVATDDERVAATARSFGAEVVMTSRDCRCGSERVREVALGRDAELFINVQADEIGLQPEVLAPLLAVFDDPKVEMATLASPISTRRCLFDPALVKVVVDDLGDALYFSRAPIPAGQPVADPLPNGVYWAHLGVYAYRREFLLAVYGRPPSRLELVESLEQLRVLESGGRIRVLPCSCEHIGVNTSEDYQTVRTTWEQPSRG